MFDVLVCGLKTKTLEAFKRCEGEKPELCYVFYQAAGNDCIVLLMNGCSNDVHLALWTNSLFMCPQRVQQHRNTVQ